MNGQDSAMEALKERYQKHSDKRIHGMFFCGDGKNTEWELQYPAFDIIEMYQCMDHSSRPAFAYEDCYYVMNGKSLSIYPPIPQNVMVRVDYWTTE